MSRHPLVPRGTKIDLINGVTLKFNGRTILQHLCKDRDYFEFNIKLGLICKMGTISGTKLSIHSPTN